MLVLVGSVYVYNAPSQQPPMKAINPYAVECSCIRTARDLGLDIPYNTNAKDIKPNTHIAIGVGVLFNDGDGHIAIVISIRENGFWIKEGDYKNCKITERFIEWTDDKLLGFYDPKLSP